MISTNLPIASAPQPIAQPQRPHRPWLQILASAFLAFGIAAPSASAKCYSKQIVAPVITPAMAAANNAAVQADTSLQSTLQNVGPVSIVGLWNVTFSSGGQVVDVAFDAWHSDGTEILNDYTNPIEGNVCLGVWQQTGIRTYKLKHPSWSFDSNGNLQGTVIIGEKITVSPDGNSYSGSYTYSIYDTSGNFLEQFTGQIKATRIKPD